MSNINISRTINSESQPHTRSAVSTCTLHKTSRCGQECHTCSASITASTDPSAQISRVAKEVVYVPPLEFTGFWPPARDGMFEMSVTPVTLALETEAGGSKV